MKNNNKGAAMVSVLIAILFISLLAGTLLITAGYNYMAKSMRWSSTDNFYTAEFGLADLSTTLQNIAAQYTSKSSASDAVYAAIGGYDIGSGKKAWNKASVESIITKASKVNSISVNYSPKYDTNGDGSPEEACLVVGSDSIILKGVEITSYTDTGFSSVITTDLKIVFESLKSPMDVNDFSVITDSPIDVYGRSILFAGHIFIGHGSTHKDFNESTGSYGVEALSVGKSGYSTNVFIMNKGVIAGDITVAPSSVLDISGEVTVYGKIRVESGGSLIVSGTLRTTGGITKATGASIKAGREDTTDYASGYKNIIFDKKIPLTGVVDDRLAHELLVDVKSFDDAGASFNLKFDSYQSTNSEKTNISNSLDGKSLSFLTGAQMDNLIMNGFPSGVDGALVLSKANIQLKKDYPMSTILTEGKITMGDGYNGWSSYYTNLSDEQYDLLKNHTYLTGSADGYSLDGSAAGGTKITISEDGEGRYVYESSGDYAVPAGYFINEKSASIISSAFAASMGEEDPKNTYVVYSNWDKL